MLRAIAVQRSNAEPARGPSTIGTIVLRHDERHLRRKTISLRNGVELLVDLPTPVVLVSGDKLVLDNGAVVEVDAAQEPLYAVTANGSAQLAELAWHIGNRHLPAAIFPDQILILRDHVIKSMLEGLGAAVRETVAPFSPVRGAYDGQEHGHDLDHNQSHPNHQEHS
ncbi:urease accessory protein UreE [Bradyrhizobium sp. 41S5]|uniref:urease accessory protein UreE n=1 Tax=Bradyrhizobium sp. 41S5 TaxID=1404443 RepID=UPI00156AE1A3|nr:urease accessory protein UreE [Bradyrhizobium sp. 41S5]UFX48286.1 urease accessory protein UreE [Bradyrhizobium sp. 41S5]